MQDEAVTVIINVFNEANTLEAEVRDIYEKIIFKLPKGSELIIAEDGSTDGTKEIIADLVQRFGAVHSTSVERKGYTKAMRDAIQLAKAPWIFYSDTGGKNDFNDFWLLYEKRSGSALVLGHRSGRTDQIYRRVLTWGYNFLLRQYFGVPVTDADSGFRLYDTALVQKVAAQEWINKELIGSEIVIRINAMGGKIVEVPVTYRQRAGESRGLPLKKIPKTILGVLSRFKKLKQDVHLLKKS